MRGLLTVLVIMLSMMSFLAKGDDLPRYADGTYNIALVVRSDNKQVDLRHIPISIELEIKGDTVTLTRTHDLYTPQFGEGESLDLDMKVVETEKVSVKYSIVEYKADPENADAVYASCLTEDGEPCKLINGVIGTISDGRKLLAFNFSDPIFADIYWCYEEDDK